MKNMFRALEQEFGVGFGGVEFFWRADVRVRVEIVKFLEAGVDVGCISTTL